MSDVDEKSQAQSAERTDAGIYTGVEKFTKEDNPQDNVAYDPATGEQTGAGMPPTTAELSHRSESDGKETIGHEVTPGSREATPGSREVTSGSHEASTKVPTQDPRDVEALRQAVVPAPAPSREHLLENYPHVFPQLEKQAAEEEAKKKEEAEKKTAESSDSSSSEEEVIDGTSDSSGNEEKKNRKDKKSDEEHSHHHHHHHHDESDGHHHRGPVKAIAHALHLDRHDRKLKKKAEKEEKKEMEERKKNIKKRNRKAEMNVNELTQTDEIRFELSPPDKTADVSEGGAVSDARTTHAAIPLEILNPEGLERKMKEDIVLETGGDFQELAWKTDEPLKIPGDRIDTLIQVEHARVKAGLPIEEPEKEIKVAFHTADSFDRLDKLKT